MSLLTVSPSSTSISPMVASARQPLKTPRQKHETRSSDAESLTFAPQHRYIGKLVPPPRTLHQAPCRRAYSSSLAILSGSFLLLCAQYFSRFLDLSACSSSFAFNSRNHFRPRDHSWVRRYMDLVSTTPSSCLLAAFLTPSQSFSLVRATPCLSSSRKPAPKHNSSVGELSVISSV